MSKKDRKSPATVRIFNLVLSYDTSSKDDELEKVSLDLIEQINAILIKHIKNELPQLSLEEKKKLKIGVLPHDED